MKPLDYTKRLTGPVEDTRRVVVMRHPEELTAPDPSSRPGKAVYRWGGWRGTEQGGKGIWQSEEMWGGEPTPFPYDRRDWHYTRRDVCVDVECPNWPELWWLEFFGGIRAKRLKVSRGVRDGVEEIETVEADGRSNFCVSHTGTGLYVGSRRAPAYFYIYCKYLRKGVHVNVRQCHLDAWTLAGWNGGMVVRVEARLSRPSPLDGMPYELFADAVARIRLLDRRPPARACDVKTAERWLALCEPAKRERDYPAPLEKYARLKRAMSRLVAEHDYAACSLALLLAKPTKPDRED